MVAEVRVQYNRRVEGYYVKDGKPTTELGTVRRSETATHSLVHPKRGWPPMSPGRDETQARRNACRGRGVAR